MKKVPRNKFASASRPRKRGRSFSEGAGKSISDLLLNIETRIRGELSNRTGLGVQKSVAVARVPFRPNPVHHSRYVE